MSNLNEIAVVMRHALMKVSGDNRALASDVLKAQLERALSALQQRADSDDKRYDESMQLQAIGKSAMSSIADMVAALECDYDRLEELKEERASHKGSAAGSGEQIWDAQYPLEREELTELESAAGDCESRDDAEQRIQEDPLSIEMRSDWETLDVWHGRDSGRGHGGVQPAEFTILLGTGGPATRIMGELNEHGEPTRAWIQAQDWFKPWTDYIGGDQETLLTYCRCFYFGEG